MAIRWEQPTVSSIRRIIRHPAYASAYVYGMQQWRKVRAGGDPVPESWIVGQYVEIWEHHPGYIPPEEHEEFQRILALNAKTPKQAHLGPGAALLQGRCRCCEHGAMMVAYPPS